MTIKAKKPSRSAGRNFIASLSNGLSVLEAVADSRADISLAAIAARVGLQKTSTWRLVHTLVELGYLHQDPQTRNFRPAPRVLAVGYAYFDGLDLKQLSLPFMRELSARYNETASMAVRDGDQLIYVERIKSSQIVAVNLGVGSHLPLYYTSLGRALISEMPDSWVREYIQRIPDNPKARKYLRDGGKGIFKTLRETRERGYAINDEESVKGLRVIASPIRDRTSEVVAAICVSVPSSRWSVPDLRRVLAPDLLTTAGKISLALGYRGRQSDPAANSDSNPGKEFAGRSRPPISEAHEIQGREGRFRPF